jgi:hypothetical protein
VGAKWRVLWRGARGAAPRRAANALADSPPRPCCPLRPCAQNAEHLASLCPHSCATCTIKCEDTDVSCGNWAKGGQCKSNAGFMLKACPTSCGLCTPTCQDANTDCAGWMASGACADNAEFMHKHCPVTCGVCRDECKDTHDDCPGWAADGQCHKNPGFVLKTCPGSCEVCSASVCDDKNATQCAIWGETECTVNAGAMMRDCPKT